MMEKITMTPTNVLIDFEELLKSNRGFTLDLFTIALSTSDISDRCVISLKALLDDGKEQPRIDIYLDRNSARYVDSFLRAFISETKIEPCELDAGYDD